jgi:hypothetical protein
MDQTNELLRDTSAKVLSKELDSQLVLFKKYYFPLYAKQGMTFAEAWICFQLQNIKEGVETTNELLEEIYPAEGK